MSMRAGFEFTVSTMDNSPIASELAMEALASTPYEDHFSEMVSPPTGGDEYFYLSSPDELSAYFSDIHPEEFDAFFDHFTAQRPDTTFLITTYQHEATEMRQAGSDAWLARGDKTVGVNWDLDTKEIVFLCKALNFVNANLDDFIEATGLVGAEPVLQGLLDNVKDVQDLL